MTRRGDLLRLTASQSFNELEVKLLNELMSLMLRGADPRALMRRPEARGIARKFATMKTRIGMQKQRREAPLTEEPMRAITLWQPWASAVGRPIDGKDIENRATLRPPRELLTNPRPFFAIHGGAKYDESPTSAALGVKPPPGRWAFPRAIYGGAEPHIPPPHLAPKMHIVAVARVRYALDLRDPAKPVVLGVDPTDLKAWGDALNMPKQRWWLGPIGWSLMDRFELSAPVKCKGALGVWSLPPDVEAKVVAAMPPAAREIERSIREARVSDRSDKGEP